MKKQITKSPLKVENGTKKTTTVKQEVSKNKWTGSSTSKSAAAGAKLKEKTTVIVPGKKSTANVDALNSKKIHSKKLEGYGLKHPKARAAANKADAEARAKDAAASTPDTVVEKPAPQTEEESNDASKSFEADRTEVVGMTAPDTRGEGRNDIVLARQAGKFARKEAKYTEKAAKTKNVAKKAMFEARAKGFKAAGDNVAERQMYAKQKAEQGSWGNLKSASGKRQTLSEQEFESEGLVKGSNAVSDKKATDAAIVEPAKTTETTSPKAASINDVQASAKAADTEMQKRYAKKDEAKKDGATSRGAVEIDHEGLKKSSGLNMMKSSALKMFKPGSFKMGGFGSKSKK